MFSRWYEQHLFNSSAMRLFVFVGKKKIACHLSVIVIEWWGVQGGYDAFVCAQNATRAGADKKDREAEAHIYTRRNCAAASRVTLCNLSTESRRDVISSCQGRGCACSSLPEIVRRFFSLAFPSNQQRLRLQSPDERPSHKVNIYRCSGNIYIGLDRCSGKIGSMMSDLFKKRVLRFLATCN